MVCLVAEVVDGLVGEGSARKNFGRAGRVLGHVLLELGELVNFSLLCLPVAAPSLPVEAHGHFGHQEWFLLGAAQLIVWLGFLLSLAQLHKLTLLLLSEDRGRPCPNHLLDLATGLLAPA